MDESSEKNTKNPMQLRPVIRCVFKFLKIEDIKNCRPVSREWGSTGKITLTGHALIHFYNHIVGWPSRRPADFYSCFQDSAYLFSAFKISGFLTEDSEDNRWWTNEELTKFFERQHKYLEELTLKLGHCSEDRIEKNIDLSSWISKSPMVQKDTKQITKLSFKGDLRKYLDTPPWHLIVHIKDLKLSKCRINLEEGIKICPIKLKLKNVTFFQDEIKLDQVRINDFVDFSKAKDVSLSCYDCSKLVLDLMGNTTLDNLSIEKCHIVNGETSQWTIGNLVANKIPCSLNRQMNIKDLFLFPVGSLDLFTLPNSIEKLFLNMQDDTLTISCSQPIILENLQIIQIFNPRTECSFLSHFMNCPQLTFLELSRCHDIEMKSIWIPKSIKTATLVDSLIKLVDDNYLNLDKLICCTKYCSHAKELCNAKIRVQDLVMIITHCWSTNMNVYEDFVDFLECRNRFSFANRLYIGPFKWDEEQLEETVLKEHVDVQSSCYVFESREKGRAISNEAFLDMVPKHYCKEDVFPEDQLRPFTVTKILVPGGVVA